MSRTDKLIERLKRKPKDFKWNELVTILNALGYRELTRGKTGGSRRRFAHQTAALIILHEPHPRNELKAYQIELILETLAEEGLI